MFSNTTGDRNTAMGNAALGLNVLGDDNVAIGQGALFFNTVSGNTAVGSGALLSNSTGTNNSAIGFQALNTNTTASFSTAVGFQADQHSNNNSNDAFGFQALLSDTSGGFNVAMGVRTLNDLIDGSFNTAIGNNAGNGLQHGDGNLFLGQGTNPAAATESNHTYIRNVGSTNQPVGPAGIRVVTVNSTTNLLGSTSLVVDTGGISFPGGFNVVSSRRFKDEIKPLDKGSEVIYALKPVSFRYKADKDPTRTLRAGLIAEEVQKVDPDLVVRDEEGKPERVRLDSITGMLLNEFLKEHKKVEAQQASIAELKSTVALQQKEMEVLTAQLKEQAAQIQRVSAQIEVSKAAPRTVANK
jgi:hypothetical protein